MKMRKEGQKRDVWTGLVLFLASLALLSVSLGRLEFAEALISGQQHARRSRNARTVYTSSLENYTTTGGNNERAGAARRWAAYSQQQADQAAAAEQCCACDEAKYELVFEGLWSRYTHPDDFPENFGLAYFSDIIGASHSDNFRMWSLGAHASEGVRELAETGATKRLELELKQVSAKTRTIIKARELRYPTLNSKTSAVFRTDRQHHLVSVLSKLGPSPDWMLGVSALELCQPDCAWATQRVVNLHLLDAGTDSGTTFTAPDQPTRPQDKIRYFRKVLAMQEPGGGSGAQQGSAAATSESEPNSALFYDQTLAAAGSPTALVADNVVSHAGGSRQQQQQQQQQQREEQLKPFARLTITRQRIYEKSCDSAPAPSDTAPTPAVVQPPIKTTGDYDYPSPSGELANTPSSTIDCRFTDWSDWSTCSSQCGKGIRTRTRSFLADDQAQLAGCQQADLIEKEICLSECLGPNVTCVTRDWSDWSKCSLDCGQGMRKRTRAPIGGALALGCESVELAEVEQCSGPCESAQPEPADALSSGPARSTSGAERRPCELSAWSQWSECPVACGRGTMIRVRQFLRPDDAAKCNPVKMIEKQPCMGKSHSCAKLADKEPTGYSSTRQGKYDSANSNNKKHPHHGVTNPDLPVIDCELSNWGPWSTCSALCGQGKRTRSRYIIQMPQNGGKPCDKKLTRMQRCKDLPPCPPVSVHSSNSSNKDTHNNHHHHHQQRGGKSHHHHAYHHRPSLRTTTTTTTTTQVSSMTDDEDDGKFSKLIRSDMGHELQLIAPSWTPPESTYHPNSGNKALGSNMMELIGSSNFQIKNGYLYSSLLGNLTVI